MDTNRMSRTLYDSPVYDREVVYTTPRRTVIHSDPLPASLPSRRYRIVDPSPEPLPLRGAPRERPRATARSNP